MPRQIMVSFDVGKELLRVIEQRAKQEGVTRSEYLRECVYMELALSGDLDAMKFLARAIGARVKGALLDRFVHADVKQAEAILGGDTQ